MTVTTITDVELAPKDYASDQEVRWCPGCGDYAILKAVQKTLAELGAPRERTVFVSGIGCAARFPYYLSTYGFHTIHGRAPAIATGVKLANPGLDVWVVTGDGDGLSIGGNHMLHVLRRNVDLQIILFNNEIYGLTKGQYSPTSRRGTHSPSTPQGSIEAPVSPCAFALGAGARFVARAVDTQQADVVAVLKRARASRGIVRRGVPELRRLQRRGVRSFHVERRGERRAAPRGARAAAVVRTEPRTGTAPQARVGRARSGAGGRGRRAARRHPGARRDQPRPGAAARGARAPSLPRGARCAVLQPRGLLRGGSVRGGARGGLLG